jgi:quinoprotein glucose dehydrogenase
VIQGAGTRALRIWGQSVRKPLFTTIAITSALASLTSLTGKAAGLLTDLDNKPHRSWSMYGGGPEQTHYSELREINKENVRHLEVAWSFDTGDAFGEQGNASEMECNPIVVNGVLYAVSPKLRVFAVDAATGRLSWTFDPNQGEPVRSKRRSRGVTYWSDGIEQRIFVTSGHYLYGVDATSGKAIGAFGNSGRVDLREGLGRDPKQISAGANTPGIIYKDLLVLGSTGWSPGDIRAYDVRSGKIRWTFHTIPHPGEFGYDTWPRDAWNQMNGANDWAGMALDETRGILFVPTASGGEGDKDFFGGDRKGDNLFADSLLALDASSGRRLWHFQAVHHDLWDRDFPAPPTLITIRRDGHVIDAVAQIAKSGFVFVFDRVSGRSLFPITERRVPQTHVPGEFPSATQPFPQLPAPFTRQAVTPELLTHRTPRAFQAAASQLATTRSAGEFTAPSLEGTLLMPGTDGGGEWGGTSFDPETGLLYINANELASVLTLKRRPAVSAATGGKRLFMAECAGCHGADRKGSPPEFPSLVDVADRLTKFDAIVLISRGAGRMPSFSRLGQAGVEAVADYIVFGQDKAVSNRESPILVSPASSGPDYTFGGYGKFLDPDGYPATEPPWGTLSALDVNTGRYVWNRPLGEYPELAAQGLANTGSENYGGSVITAGGLLFIGATLYDHKFRAFDKSNGKLLWQTVLPTAANATPAIYEVNGREFVVIAVGGGKERRGENGPGGRLIAFALPKATPSAGAIP